MALRGFFGGVGAPALDLGRRGICQTFSVMFCEPKKSIASAWFLRGARRRLICSWLSVVGVVL